MRLLTRNAAPVSPPPHALLLASCALPPLPPPRHASPPPRSVLFNFLGRDFFNALSAKDQEKFSEMLIKWLAAICLGIPVYVMR